MSGATIGIGGCTIGKQHLCTCGQTAHFEPLWSPSALCAPITPGICRCAAPGSLRSLLSPPMLCTLFTDHCVELLLNRISAEFC